MKPLVVALVALVTLVLGFVGGLALGSGGSEGGRRSSEVAAGPTAPTTARPAPRAETISTPGEAPREMLAPAPLQPSEPRLSEAGFERALSSVETPELPTAARGEGVLTGRVLGADGEPLAGVRVVASRVEARQASDPANIGLASPRDPDLEETLREEAEDWARRRAGRQVTESAPDGSFRFEQLSESERYVVRGYFEGFSVRSEGGSSGMSAGQHVVLRAENVHTIPVELVRADGSPVSEGVIGVKRGDDTNYYTWTRDQPTLRLTRGLVTVRGYADVELIRWRGIDAGQASEKVDLDAAVNAGAALRLELQTQTGVRGRVIDPSGTSLRGARMKLLTLPSGAEVDTKALAESKTSVYLEGDRFVFADLEAGRYAVGAVTWEGAVLGHELVELTEGMVEIDLVLPEPDPDEHLIVRATGPNGGNLRDLEFRWRRLNGRGSRSGGISARRDPAGFYWLRPDEVFFERWGEETGFELTITHAQLGTRIVPLEEGQREVEVVFEEPVRLVVELIGYEGSGFEGQLDIQVQQLVEGESRQNQSWRYGGRGSSKPGISAAGIYTHDNLAPGDWEVKLVMQESRWQSRTLATQEVTLTQGEATVRLEVPALYDLSVVAAGFDPGTRVSLFRSTEGDAQSFRGFSSEELDQDHRAVFKGLVAGEYRIQARGMSEPVVVTVPCAEVVLDARPTDCLKVTLGDVEGTLAQAGFRSGDLILAVNGKELGNNVNSWELLRSEEELRCSVLRDGQRIDLTLPKMETNSNWTQALGGMLVPAYRP